MYYTTIYVQIHTHRLILHEVIILFYYLVTMMARLQDTLLVFLRMKGQFPVPVHFLLLFLYKSINIKLAHFALMIAKINSV
jgi:hypothetical protein